MPAKPKIEGALNDYISVLLDKNLNFSLHVDGTAVLTFAAVVLVVIALRFWRTDTFRAPFRRFEIDQAQFGLGQQTITLHPNQTDMQIAYKIWVELSTRKIGLSIDLEDDVISEIYDSWYNFFSIVRELIKDVPVSRFRRKDTEKIIRLSIEVLNTGLRPHLTKWQARFRRWYEHEQGHGENLPLTPQEIQKKFPAFADLEKDLQLVNERLINYRQKMYELVTNL